MDYLSLISFIFFTGLVGFITWRLTRKDDHTTSSTSYFLAGRSLGFGVVAGSLLLTNLSTEQLVGLNGAAFTDGFVVMAWEVVAALSLVVMALVFLPYYLRSGIATVPQFLEERFNTTTRSITTVIFIVAYAVILLPIVLYTGGVALTEMLDVPGLLGLSGTDMDADQQRTFSLWVTVWVVGLIGSVYAIFGGLRTVAISDTINGLGLLAGGLLISWLALQAVGDGSVLAGMSTLIEEHPEKFESMGTADQSVPFATIFTGVLLINLFYWTTNQQIIQRTFAARDLAEGQKGVLLAGFFKVLAPIILVLPGIAAFHLYSGDPDMRPDDAYATLVRNVLPSWLTGFFAAVIVGAVLSTFNSALNSCATLFSFGVYQAMLRPKADDREVIRSGKWFGWIIAITAMLIAPGLAQYETIFSYLQQMNALYFIPIFSVMVVGIFFRRVPAGAANVALVASLCLIAVYYWVVTPIADKIQESAETADSADGAAAATVSDPGMFGNAVVWLSGINDFHVVAVVFVLAVVGMLAAGARWPRTEPWKQVYTGDVDMTPWRLAPLVGGLLLAIVVGIYVLLAIFP